MSRYLILLIIVVVIILLARSPKRLKEAPRHISDSVWRDMVDRLKSIGFLDYVEPSARQAAVEEIVKSGFLFSPEIGCFFMADSEDLAERGVLDFLAHAGPFLEKQRIRLPIRVRKAKRIGRNPETGEKIDIFVDRPVIDNDLVDDSGKPFLKPVSEEYSQTRYVVTVGTIQQEIWNSRMGDDQMWEAAACHTMQLLNRLLEASGSRERAYGLDGGNDGYIVILTPDQYAIIRDHGGECVDQASRLWEPYEVKVKRSTNEKSATD